MADSRRRGIDFMELGRTLKATMARPGKLHIALLGDRGTSFCGVAIELAKLGQVEESDCASCRRAHRSIMDQARAALSGG